MKTIRIEAYPNADCDPDNLIGSIELRGKKRLNHIEILIDETILSSINSNSKDVTGFIKELKDLCYAYNIEINRPNTLRVTTGNRSSIHMLKLIEINYHAFRPDGAPTRALIKLELADIV